LLIYIKVFYFFLIWKDFAEISKSLGKYRSENNSVELLR